MRTLSSTLLAAQRSSSATPYLRVTLSDLDVGVPKLRWERWYTGAEADGPCAAAVPDDGALLRARIDPATGTLSHQRVAAPTASSTYSAWTSLGTVATASRLGLAAAGTRALLATVRVDGVTVEVRESTDSGATFGASAVVTVAGGTVTAVACGLLDGTGTAAVVFAAGGVVYEMRRTGTGAWSTPTAWPHSLATVNGLAVRAGLDYDMVVSGTDGAGDAGAWSSHLSASGGGWDPLAEITLASAGTGVTYLATGASFVIVPRAALVETVGGAASRVQLASGVPGASSAVHEWRDPAPFSHTSAYGLGLTAGDDDAWLVAPDGVWHAPTSTPAEDLTDDVIEADFSISMAGGRLRLVLRNDDGRYYASSGPIALEPRGELQIDLGFVTSAGAEWSIGPRYWITSVVRRREGGRGTVEIEAVDGWGVLRAWHAPRQFTWAAGALQAWQIIDATMARAGLRLLTSGSSEASLLLPASTVRAGQDGASAVRRVLATIPDELRPSGGAFRPFEPLASDATSYAYGLDHALSAVRWRAGERAAGWVRVLGAGLFGEAVEDEALLAGAPTAVVVDDNLTVQARVDARAQTALRQAALTSDLGEIVVPMNVGQELGDVIEVSDAASGLDAARARVVGLRYRYVRGGSRPRYDLTLSLSEV
ncbi:MAG: hypothetical protein R3C39_03915 [Dehalococcoidia bacterium]